MGKSCAVEKFILCYIFGDGDKKRPLRCFVVNTLKTASFSSRVGVCVCVYDCQGKSALGGSTTKLAEQKNANNKNYFLPIQFVVCSVFVKSICQLLCCDLFDGNFVRAIRMSRTKVKSLKMCFQKALRRH